jgi:hypothetical protein
MLPLTELQSRRYESTENNDLKNLIFNKLAHYTLLFIKVHAETSPPHRAAIATVIRYGCSIYLFIGLIGAHTRTSLASESGLARVPMSQTRPCVECHEPDFGRLYIYPSLAPESRSPRRTRESDSYVYEHLYSHYRHSDIDPFSASQSICRSTDFHFNLHNSVNEFLFPLARSLHVGVCFARGANEYKPLHSFLFLNAHCANSTNINGRPLRLAILLLVCLRALGKENCFVIIDVIVF